MFRGNGSAQAGPIDVGRLRMQVLEDAARADAQVRLGLVPEHRDLGRSAIRELELVAEVDDSCTDTGYRRRHRDDAAAVVGRPGPEIVCADAAGAARPRTTIAAPATATIRITTPRRTEPRYGARPRPRGPARTAGTATRGP